MRTSLQNYWRLLARHIQPQRARFRLLIVSMLGGIGLQLLNPQIMRSFIDRALGGGALNGLLWMAFAFIAVALLQQAVGVVTIYVGENVAWTATNVLRAELAAHCLNLDMSFHNNHTPGELIERIDGDIAELKDFFSKLVLTVLGNGLLLIGILVVVFFADWRAGLAYTLFAGIALFAMGKLRNLAVPDQKERRQAEAQLFGFIEEQLTGAEDIRSSGAVDFSLHRLIGLQADILRPDQRAHFKSWIINGTTNGLLTVANILALTTGYLLYTRGAITIGTVYLLVHYVNMIETPLWELSRQMESFQTIGACVERLNELSQVTSKLTEAPHGAALAPGALGLRFENVSFAYQDGPTNGSALVRQPNPRNGKAAPQLQIPAAEQSAGLASSAAAERADAPVLRDLSFALGAGRVLGVLGHTGSGKTTLSRLVFRMFDPSAGRIVLGESDLRAVSLEGLHQRVGVVTQDVQLFRASVRDNLTFFNQQVRDDQILAAIEALDLHAWFAALADGLDTRLESGGRSLSAGEGQLLALTRIFLRQPGLVILDEASSRLDPATEQHIERALDRLLDGRTAIIIAHRLATVQRADDILILQQGQVVEFGPRAELAHNPASRFAALLHTGLEEVLV